MSNLALNHWQYLHGRPSVDGDLKTTFEDFVVEEQLGYAPCGEGEHIYLWVEKQGLNTAYVAEQLAKFSQLPLRAVTYAGRKDKHALTRQWFCVHLPGKQEIQWQQMQLEGLRILESMRHNKKLRTGVLKGNRFELRLRNLSSTQGLEKRLEAILAQGVPNYFGEQRFGHQYPEGLPGNLQLAQKMLDGETIRNRNKRSIAISALRSWLFNEFIHHRLAKQLFDQPISGDVCILSGSNSFFCAEQVDQDIAQRFASRDILLSAPMWGEGDLASQSTAREFEQAIADSVMDVTSTLASLGLKQERRAICLYPQDLQWKLTEQDMQLSFSLPSGCFATSVVRELVNVRSASPQAQPAQGSNNHDKE